MRSYGVRISWNAAAFDFVWDRIWRDEVSAEKLKSPLILGRDIRYARAPPLGLRDFFEIFTQPSFLAPEAVKANPSTAAARDRIE